jgi:hypothetical protein
MATLTACVGSCLTAPPLASPRIVAQSQPKNTKSRRLKRSLLDRASTYVPPTWQNGSRCRFASSQAHLRSWPNPHSTRGTTAAHIPRFRALALFGRRPLERVDSPAIPASENLHKTGSRRILFDHLRARWRTRSQYQLGRLHFGLSRLLFLFGSTVVPLFASLCAPRAACLTSFCTPRTSFLTPLCAARASLLTPFRTGLRRLSGRRSGSGGCLGVSV